MCMPSPIRYFNLNCRYRLRSSVISQRSQVTSFSTLLSLCIRLRRALLNNVSDILHWGQSYFLRIRSNNCQEYWLRVELLHRFQNNVAACRIALLNVISGLPKIKRQSLGLSCFISSCYMWYHVVYNHYLFSIMMNQTFPSSWSSSYSFWKKYYSQFFGGLPKLFRVNVETCIMWWNYTNTRLYNWYSGIFYIIMKQLLKYLCLAVLTSDKSFNWISGARGA